MCRVISFVASAGGVGQTSLIFELSKSLAKRNFRVCVFDAHFNLNVLSLKYGLEDSHDLADFLVANINANEALSMANPHLYVVKTNQITFNYLKFSEGIKRFFADINQYFDFILIDTSTMNSAALSLCLECSNESVLVLTDDFFAIRSGAKILQKIYFYENIVCVNLVLNKMRVITEIEGEALGEKEISEIFNMQPLFVFPKFYKNNYFKPSKKAQKQSSLFDEFGNSLVNNSRRDYDYKKRYRGVLGFFRRKIFGKFE